MYYIAGVSAVPSAQPTQRRRQRCTPASDAASAPWGDLGRRGFLSGSYISKGGSSSSGSSGGASEGIGSVITAALRGLGGGGSSGALAAAVNGAGAADAGLLAEGLEHGQAAWAARMRFRRQEPTFQVIECFPNGVARESRRPRTASQLELHPRDVVLFAPISRLAAPQRATIAVREDKILFKTEVAQAIISADKAVLIIGRRDRDAKQLAAEIIKVMGRAEAPTNGGDVDFPGPSDAPGALPFELRVLEVLLDATVEYFYTKTQHLNWMMESIGDEIKQPRRPFNATDKAHQLIPIQKFLTSIKNDVRETCEALVAMSEDEEHLQELCLTWQRQLQQAIWAQQPAAAPQVQYSACPETGVLKPAPTASFLNEVYEANHPPGTGAVTAHTKKHSASGGSGHGRHGGHGGHDRHGGGGHGHGAPHSQMSSAYLRTVSDMLESYEREIRSLEGSLLEAEENLDNTREVWHMQLDSSRNHIILVNLWLSMINISVMATTILPAFFGMNLHSGLPEESMKHFYMVVAASIVIATLSYPLGRWIYFRHWRKMTQHELFEQKMLRVLLVQHIDDLDDIIDALRKVDGPIDRRRFRDVVTSTLGNRAITAANVNFLFDIFDA
ncbi:hypothetical protein MNEG_2127 [Monoraphidium neglectum]|uniref:Magnesium transporter n=1 Tax=Monoraphidium neglectum TaxID=145388 RepID=A0A0D2MZV5_9CHLO|nr:hypothetical protein MNEG_2127 [Monoraphidium neglectum]KIZ05832.1 hypothetical protein MNEG_2127 [Monoraphidium neglectum]|eukprot:XP_013904851.1 hypothetical protein MNEG_2127 [Monoraphidium neglectum]